MRLATILAVEVRGRSGLWLESSLCARREEAERKASDYRRWDRQARVVERQVWVRDE